MYNIAAVVSIGSEQLPDHHNEVQSLFTFPVYDACQLWLCLQSADYLILSQYTRQMFF